MPPPPDDAPDEFAALLQDTTPARRKAAGAGQNSTPRRASAVKRNNGTPSGSPKTPIRKTSGNVIKTPNTAPARAKTGNAKKPEATLLGDFLLGRPSPARQRRRSLDLVKQELKEANVGTIKVPGGVKDRVKQWQKTSTPGPVVVEDATPEKKGNATGGRNKAAKREDGNAEEEDQSKLKSRAAKRPGRRKSKDDGGEEDAESSRSKSAPRKRVVSDSHWMTENSPKKNPPTKDASGQKIPKDFLAKTAVKRPLDQRVQDWIKISDAQGSEEKEIKPRSRKPSKQEPRASKGTHDGDWPSRTKSNSIDTGSRINPKDDDVWIHTSEVSPEDADMENGIRVKPVRKDGSKNRSRKSGNDGHQTPTRRAEKHIRPLADLDSTSRASSLADKKRNGGDDLSFGTPSPPEKSRRKPRKSDNASDLSEIPFGNSAFSVLEMPLGAEAGSMRRPPPKRSSSFGVPKVLKKVYNAVHDGVDPARNGPNQPASIESWLNSTSDPFVDRPSKPDAAPSREASLREDGRREIESVSEQQTEKDAPRERPARYSFENLEPESNSKDDASLKSPKTRDSLPSMNESPPISPLGLKRSPATRNTSSPKVARKSLFKDAIFDAFKGESAMAGKTAPNPFAEITGLRERDLNRAPDLRQSSRDYTHGSEDTPPKRSPRPSEISASEESSSRQERSLPSIPKGPPPTTGHRLSTIASVETFSSFSATETASELTQTTLTQNSALTKTTASSISRKSNNKPNKPSVKRRLTKHSDLLSVLSLPDAAQPGRSKSIRSARSVRTTRTRLDTATVQDLMRELAEDEVKYTRELKTLVDGVIPVLLTCVLSKSKSAIAAGLFNPDSSPGTGATLTKPIVDMGVALERLKSLHRRIPLDDADAFIGWASSAHKTYQDYLASWRTGFQDVVVNLAPALRSASTDLSTMDEIPRNENGDVVGANGERVDVAYLLKRPLVRIKYLSKAVKGFEKLKPTASSTMAMETWTELEKYGRTRVKEEAARLVDLAANSTDATRARDPSTLAPVEGVKIDQTRQVYAKDFFSFYISHSNGQRIECRVEVLVRDKASNPNDGDVLICEVNEIRKFLLFPPISKNSISARLGDNKNQLVVLIRGVNEAKEWQETLLLEAEDEEAATEWLDMLGTVPIPPPLSPKHKDTDLRGDIDNKSIVSLAIEGDIPIGERRRREAEEAATPKRDRQRSSRHAQAISTMPDSVKEGSTNNTPRTKDLNDAMDKAGTPSKRPRAARYHSRSQSTPGISFTAEMSGALDPYLQTATASPEPAKDNANNTSSPEHRGQTVNLPYIPKVRHSAPTTPDKTKSSTPLRESMRPESEDMKANSPAQHPREDDVPPPPPPHRTLTPTGLKNIPILDTSTKRAQNRRSSSPLKHEYQPSDGSGTSSSEESGSESDSYSESSDEDDLEASDLPSAAPILNTYGNKRVSSNGSMYNIPNASLAPSNSASQAPYRGVPAQRSPEVTRKTTATVSGWSDDKGRWVDLHPEPCSIIVTPGLIEVFELSAAHCSPQRGRPTDPNQSTETIAVTPLIGQVLTPVVPLRQSTAIDIEITSKATSESRLAAKYRIIRYRTATNIDCQSLYRSVHEGRLTNPAYVKLEQERRVNGFGTYNTRGQDRRRSWMFGRKRSYRASTRAPSEIAESEQSGRSHSSVFSALRRMSGGSFNIAKSTVDRSSVAQSTYTSNPSDYSGPTPPHTPTSPSLMGSSYSNTVARNLGSENLKIRLYHLDPSGKWDDLGAARLTVTSPPPGMRQASSLYHGVERRIIVTRKAPVRFSFLGSGGTTGENRMSLSKIEEENTDSFQTLLDVILGAACFVRVGNTGIVANVWEDVVGPNGEVGMVRAVGGVSGTTRKWLFQTGSGPDASWIWSLVAVGR